ncbi:MAG: heme o synthase [Myxococcota bacterium]
MNEARGRIRDFVSLLKPRVTLLVVATAAAGMGSAAPRPDLPHALAILFAIGLLAGSANALNCWVERDSDRHMTRTRHRALPAGRLTSMQGLVFGVLVGTVALATLVPLTQPLTAGLGALALGSYVLLYTPLKRVTPWALHVGAIPGALPALMGRTAVTGVIDAVGLALFAVLLVWQVPHFLAIAIRRRDEYARAGLRVAPVVQGERSARMQAFVTTSALVPVSLVLAWLGAAGRVFALTALLLGLGLLAIAGRGLHPAAGRRWATALFGSSIVYLTLYVGVFLADVQVE